MCLILFAYHYHPEYKLILIANRDEFYHRPTRPMQYWPDQPHLLAGKNLEQGGTWLGLTRNGRFSALTNYRNGLLQPQGYRSRGHLPLDFLLSDQRCDAFIRHTNTQAFNGFNQLIDDGEQLCYLSNQADTLQPVPTGIHGISNAVFDTPWPKLVAAKQALKNTLDRQPFSADSLIQLMQDPTTYSDEELPNTGIAVALERQLSASFIRSEHYGTRATTALLIKHDGSTTVVEQNYDAQGTGERHHFCFDAQSALMTE
ncbi:NRDE family protein [Amphritea sp. 1_MG-2023]|uniref:NRDE family protein n=1 Tax=Amphritea sp. 1_MG-2023 TaxID=3062670 RepID=UPI0026E1BAC7|nr:NRDE family protein [Amphritea sp. 1_MG-2023]MDO6565196.1 NRDE family protein [Amphritea sp. 1_MG-2023]